MNLYQEKISQFLSGRPEKLFNNCRIDLNNYFYHLRMIKSQVEKSGARKLKFRKEIFGKEKQVRFYLDEDAGNQDDVAKKLFENYVKYLYRDEKINSGIKILERDEEEGYVMLDPEPEGEKAELFLKEDTYQIQRQINAVLRLRDRPLEAHLPLLRLFADPKDESLNLYDEHVFEHEKNWEILTDEERDGNEEQRKFVLLALATADFAMLEGPPGSGKTTTIIELILQYCKQGKRVLLVSSTHVAVDNVLKRILIDFKEQCQEEICPVRIASNIDNIRYPEVEAYSLPRLVRTKAKDSEKYLRNMSVRTESQQAFLDSLRKSTDEKGYPDYFEKAILESANLVAGTMIGVLQHPMIKNQSLDVPFDVMIVDEASKVTFQEFIVPALYAKKWILVGDVKQLSPYVEGEYLELALKEVFPEKWSKHLEVLFPLWRDAHRFIGKRVLRILLSNDLQEELVSLQDDFVELSVVIINELKDDPGFILKLNAADVILCRSNGRFREYLEKHIRVPAVCYEGCLSGDFLKLQDYHGLKDKNHRKKEKDTWERELAHRYNQYYSFRSDQELGKHLLKEIDFLTLKSGENIVYKLNKDPEREHFSDDYQNKFRTIQRLSFPSILELLQNGLGETIHKDRKLDRILYDGFPTPAKKVKFISLKFQHRMEDEIARIPRKYFYKDKNLQSSNKIHGRVNTLNNFRPNEPSVVWVQNSGDRSKQKYRYKRHKRSYENHREANQIIQEVRDFIHWARNKQNPKTYEVAVLCFYRDQESLLRRKLQQLHREKRGKGPKPVKNFHFNNVKVILCTVDRFQGDEADMVLLSFSIASRGAFYKSPNRLNVALTRARYKLVLFGNMEWFKKKAPSEALRQLAQDFDHRLTSKPLET